MMERIGTATSLSMRDRRNQSRPSVPFHLGNMSDGYDSVEMTTTPRTRVAAENSSAFSETAQSFTESIQEIRLQSPEKPKVLSDYGFNKVTYSVNDYSPRFKKNSSGCSLKSESVDSLSSLSARRDSGSEVKAVSSCGNLKTLTETSPRQVVLADDALSFERSLLRSSPLVQTFKCIVLAAEDVKPWFTRTVSARFLSVDRLETIVEDENESTAEEDTDSSPESDCS